MHDAGTAVGSTFSSASTRHLLELLPGLHRMSRSGEGPGWGNGRTLNEPGDSLDSGTVTTYQTRDAQRSDSVSFLS